MQFQQFQRQNLTTPSKQQQLSNNKQPDSSCQFQENVISSSNFLKQKGVISSQESLDSTKRQNSERNQQERINVIIRVRPFLSKEDQTQYLTLINNTNLKINRPGNTVLMKFNQVLSQSSIQSDLYNHVSNNITAFFQGINSSIFAYGQTGAGKTYSILGDLPQYFNQDSPLHRTLSGESRGIMPRALQQIIEYYENTEAFQNEDIKLVMSFYEIYNEKVFDLFQSNSGCFKEELEIRETKFGDVNIPGLQQIQIFNFRQAIDILSIGLENRITGSTQANNQSSRSHSIFEIRLLQRYEGQYYPGCSMKIVDLAGSEKYKLPKFISQEEKEIRVQELTAINGSLSALSNCIQALTDKNRKHIPYRNSKLTRVLSDCLSGEGQITFIICVSPSIEAAQETFSTLQFADRAKKAILQGKNLKEVYREYQQKQQQQQQQQQQKIYQEQQQQQQANNDNSCESQKQQQQQLFTHQQVQTLIKEYQELEQKYLQERAQREQLEKILLQIFFKNQQQQYQFQSDIFKQAEQQLQRQQSFKQIQMNEKLGSDCNQQQASEEQRQNNQFLLKEKPNDIQVNPFLFDTIQQVNEYLNDQNNYLKDQVNSIKMQNNIEQQGSKTNQEQLDQENKNTQSADFIHFNKNNSQNNFSSNQQMISPSILSSLQDSKNKNNNNDDDVFQFNTKENNQNHHEFSLGVQYSDLQQQQQQQQEQQVLSQKTSSLYNTADYYTSKNGGAKFDQVQFWKINDMSNEDQYKTIIDRLKSQNFQSNKEGTCSQRQLLNQKENQHQQYLNSKQIQLQLKQFLESSSLVGDKKEAEILKKIQDQQQQIDSIMTLESQRKKDQTRSERESHRSNEENVELKQTIIAESQANLKENNNENEHIDYDTNSQPPQLTNFGNRISYDSEIFKFLKSEQFSQLQNDLIQQVGEQRQSQQLQEEFNSIENQNATYKQSKLSLQSQNNSISQLNQSSQQKQQQYSKSFDQKNNDYFSQQTDLEEQLNDNNKKDQIIKVKSLQQQQQESSDQFFSIENQIQHNFESFNAMHNVENNISSNKKENESDFHTDDDNDFKFDLDSALQKLKLYQMEDSLLDQLQNL